MFKTIATGNNEYYGKKGEIIFIGDYHFLSAIRSGWVELKKSKYIGNPNKYKIRETIPTIEKGCFIKRVNIEELVKQQNKAYLRILKELSFINKKRNDVLNVMKTIK